jgi:hypothetical protein
MNEITKWIIIAVLIILGLAAIVYVGVYGKFENIAINNCPCLLNNTN